VGFFIIPADKDIALLPDLLKNILAPHLLQNPLLAFEEELNHLSVFFDLKTIFSSKIDVYEAKFP
tara:strand:- start:431 stop:625 length:195 start_codon:yes stop_codon:yes gene_type:complete